MSDHCASRELGRRLPRPSTYDRVAGLLLSLLILSGTAVLVMFCIWITMRPRQFVMLVPDPVDGWEYGLLDVPLENGDLYSPEPDELASMLPTESVASLLSSISAETLTEIAIAEVGPPAGRGGADGKRVGGRPVGKDDPPQVPRWERWEVRYASSNLNSYARQLDFFEIELGAAGGGRSKVDYASGFTKDKPQVRSAAGDKETRLYFTWKHGVLQENDRQLLRRAGIEVDGRVVLQFYPPAVEETLAMLEAQHAAGRDVSEIRRTTFAVQPNGAGYEFVVTKQTYR